MTHGSTAHDSSPHGFELSLANQQSAHAVDEPRLLSAARRVLEDSRFTSATISLAVVDDPTIHALNRRYLDHDYPTDVLSFVLDERDGHLEGEVILSADTAAAADDEFGWPAGDEQLLYVVHGMLHLVGHRDKTASEAGRMRAAEERFLRACGIDLSADWTAARDRELCAGLPTPHGSWHGRETGHNDGDPLNHASHSTGGIGNP